MAVCRTAALATSAGPLRVLRRRTIFFRYVWAPPIVGNDFRGFLEQVYPAARYELLSEGNNRVFKVFADDQILVAKEMVDAGIPVDYTNTVSRIISKRVLVPEVTRVFRKSDGAPFDCVISRYVSGVSLADVVDRGEKMPSNDVLSEFLIEYIDACSALPRYLPGFGLYKVGAVGFKSHREFLQSYASRYWERSRRFVADRSVRLQVDKWIKGGLGPARAGSAYRTVAIDANLRNFIVRPGGTLAVTNVPIVGWSSRAHAVAAVSVHYRNHPFRAAFLSAATRGFRSDELAAVEHLEAWHLLGVMSFYAGRGSGDPRRWRNWGAPAPLIRDFSELLNKLAKQRCFCGTRR